MRMAIASTGQAIFAQGILFLIVHVILYLNYSEVAVENILYVGNIIEFFELIPFSTLWAVAFWELLPGQLWVYLALPVLSICALLRFRRDRAQLKYIVLFHVSTAVWTFFPILTSSLGDYSGP
jgi:hypothetical protein